jgi:hypothetical protein
MFMIEELTKPNMKHVIILNIFFNFSHITYKRYSDILCLIEVPRSLISQIPQVVTLENWEIFSRIIY